MTTMYIATPITGVADQNLPMVREAAKWLERRGIAPVIPHDIEALDHPGECPDWENYPGVTGQGHAGLCYLKEDLRVMLQCDQVVALPGWLKSRGAKIEVDLARSVMIPVRYWRPDLGRVSHIPMEEDDPRVAWR